MLAGRRKLGATYLHVHVDGVEEAIVLANGTRSGLFGCFIRRNVSREREVVIGKLGINTPFSRKCRHSAHLRIRAGDVRGRASVWRTASGPNFWAYGTAPRLFCCGASAVRSGLGEVAPSK